MNKVEKIEAQITKLTPSEVRKLARWLAELDAKLWDKQIEQDSISGRLDFLFQEAEAGRNGRARRRNGPS